MQFKSGQLLPHSTAPTPPNLLKEVVLAEGKIVGYLITKFRSVSRFITAVPWQLASVQSALLTPNTRCNFQLTVSLSLLPA